MMIASEIALLEQLKVGVVDAIKLLPIDFHISATFDCNICGTYLHLMALHFRCIFVEAKFTEIVS